MEQVYDYMIEDCKNVFIDLKKETKEAQAFKAVYFYWMGMSQFAFISNQLNKKELNSFRSKLKEFAEYTK